MKKNKRKETNENLKDFLETISEEIKDSYDNDLFIAQLYVKRMERQLLETFNNEQKQLYNDLIKARAEYNDLYIKLHEKILK